MPTSYHIYEELSNAVDPKTAFGQRRFMRGILNKLGLYGTQSGVWFSGEQTANGGLLEVTTPVDDSVIGMVRMATPEDCDWIIEKSHEAFLTWRNVPAPKRGEVVRQIGNVLRENKALLGRLVSLECGKILAEGEGEVQEMIDIADFAVGLSRQLYGLTIASERFEHRMLEQWHPLGVVGVISAFNFPVAVWAWNAFLALVCGNTVVWKPSEKTPLCAIALQKMLEPVLEENGCLGVLAIGVGGVDVGHALASHARVPLVSATGSTRMGKAVNQTVAARLGRSLLELGGNNALVVDSSADLDLALRATVFGAVGTAGQRCTTTRRLLLHRDIAPQFVKKLIESYGQVRIGSPLKAETLMGPLIDHPSVDAMQKALQEAREQGAEILYGGDRLSGASYPGGGYVRPAIVKARADMPIVQEETFAPILYVIIVDSMDEAIAIQNDVPQGLSSAIFTDSVRSAERFLAADGSDCGIANVNIGTSGAEIGGAFGGEKATGGGRESGSDAWKVYMRRQTQTINRSNALPLAQGIVFE